MSADALQVVAPDPKDREELLDLIAKVFSWGGYFEFRRRCRRGYVIGSHYDWNVSRVGVVDGRMVSHWGVWDYAMRIGRSRVRTGGIGAVACHADHRRRGVMSRTVGGSIEAMRRAGYDMTVLFGIRDFYHRFGYVRAWSPTSYVVAAADLPTERPTPRARPFTMRDHPALVKLHNRQCRLRTGTAVRPTYRTRPRVARDLALVWDSPEGRLAGWVVINGGSCVDCGGEAEQILRVVGGVARKKGFADVRFSGLDAHGELAKHLRRGNCRSGTDYARRGGAMIRTINLRTTLEKIAPELTARLKASPLADWKGSLLLADPRDRVGLALVGGTVTAGEPARTSRAVRGGEEIAQLILGTDEPEETIEAAGIRLTGDAKKLLPVLFPYQHPFLHEIDQF